MEPEQSSLSDTQEKLIAILPVFSAFLSIIGSGIIIRLTIKSELKTPYERILFGLSTADVSSSIVNALAAFLVPRDTSRRIWAIGNDVTCTAMGALWQITTSAFMYSGMLSLYFLLTIRFGVSQRTFKNKFEKIIHFAAFGGPLIAGFVGLGLDVYGEVRLGPGCWTVPSRPYGELFGWISTALPMGLIMPCVITCQLVIFRYCRNTLQRSAARSTQAAEIKDAKTRDIAIQSFSYVASFLLVNIWPTILRILDDQGVGTEKDVFVLLVLQAIFLPIQGFLNCLVYIRPRFLSQRRRYPEKSTWSALIHVIETEPVSRRFTSYTGSSTSILGSVRGRLSRVFQSFNSSDPQPAIGTIHVLEDATSSSVSDSSPNTESPTLLRRAFISKRLLESFRRRNFGDEMPVVDGEHELGGQPSDTSFDQDDVDNDSSSAESVPSSLSVSTGSRLDSQNISERGSNDELEEFSLDCSTSMENSQV